MNELFIKLLEALRGEDMFCADFNDKDGAKICLHKGEKLYEVKLEEK